MTGPGTPLFVLVALAAAVLAALVAGSMGPLTRGYARLAAGLLGALAIADLIATIEGTARAGTFADAVGLLVAALLPPLLALAALAEERRRLRPSVAAGLLVLACAGGLAAAASAIRPFALLPLVLSAMALTATGLRRWTGGVPGARRTGAFLCASALALVAAASAMMRGGDGRLGVLLFLAAGLLGVVAALMRRSDAALEARRHGRGGGLLISGKD